MSDHIEHACPGCGSLLVVELGFCSACRETTLAACTDDKPCPWCLAGAL